MAKRVLILSGPTHEYIDPVRFIGNASSGLMGKALAEEALHAGYKVEFISGPVAKENLPTLSPDQIHNVIGAEEMLTTAQSLFEKADIIIFAAAVADYTPTEIQTEKIDKTSDELLLRLRPTPDIAKTLGHQKREHQITIGFALQTSNGDTHARRKLKSKNFDGIVLNTPASLGAPSGQFSFLSKKESEFKDWGLINKTDCARLIFNAIAP
jgi:phosphopantothenoylcysteine decarboxylase/phosphopantothenate--cysteine ligase